jgi:hypothetical protein
MPAAIRLATRLARYFEYYNETRCHLSLAGDAPEPRGVQGPELGGERAAA